MISCASAEARERWLKFLPGPQRACMARAGPANALINGQRDTTLFTAGA